MRPDSLAKDTIIEPVIWAEERPQFIGDFEDFCKQHLVYPDKAIINKISGKVVVEAIIRKDSTISDFKIIKGIGHGCDEEAIRLLTYTNKKWTTGKINGRRYDYKTLIVITFNLRDTIGVTRRQVKSI